MDMFTIYADDGEYLETAEGIGQAVSQFQLRRPDCCVSAVVSRSMRPRLVIEQETCVSPVLAAGSPGADT